MQAELCPICVVQTYHHHNLTAGSHPKCCGVEWLNQHTDVKCEATIVQNMTTMQDEADQMTKRGFPHPREKSSVRLVWCKHPSVTTWEQENNPNVYGHPDENISKNFLTVRSSSEWVDITYCFDSSLLRE
jgi:hypothetical protein